MAKYLAGGVVTNQNSCSKCTCLLLSQLHAVVESGIQRAAGVHTGHPRSSQICRGGNSQRKGVSRPAQQSLLGKPGQSLAPEVPFNLPAVRKVDCWGLGTTVCKHVTNSSNNIFGTLLK
jgi:hypothetical protein